MSDAVTPLPWRAWLNEYDAYYFDRRSERPLPVLRVRYADPKSTWIYFDPERGSAALVMRRTSDSSDGSTPACTAFVRRPSETAAS